MLIAKPLKEIWFWFLIHNPQMDRIPSIGLYLSFFRRLRACAEISPFSRNLCSRSWPARRTLRSPRV